MAEKDKKLIDKLQFEQGRVEDAIYGHARKNNLTDFYSEWSSKEYSDSDHNLPNMVFAFLDAVEQQAEKLKAERDKANDFIIRYYSEAGASAELDARLFLEARELLGPDAKRLSDVYLANKKAESKKLDALAIDLLFNAVYHDSIPIDAVPDELLTQYSVFSEQQKKLEEE